LSQSLFGNGSLRHGDTTLLNSLLEEVSRMLSAYASAILTSAS